MVTIRQIDDQLLYQKSRKFNQHSARHWQELKKQISLLKESTQQYTTSAGMAAVQCVEIGDQPFEIFIIGNNHMSQEFKARRLAARNIIMPREKMIINPQIISKKGEPRVIDQQCFSVCGPLRGQLPFYEFI